MNRITRLSIILCLVSLFAVSESEGSEWKLLGTTPKGDIFYYDAGSVTFVSPDIVKCWTKEEGAKGVKAYEECYLWF